MHVLEFNIQNLVWATIVQLFSFVGIDVIHHQRHILLCQIIKASITSIYIRQYAPD